MRLIDADALLEEYHELADRDFNHPMYEDTLRDIIEDAPTINPDDLRPQGRWRCWIGETMIAVDTWRSYRYFQCSECDRRTAVKTNYCPDCGAKMDGKENEDA